MFMNFGKMPSKSKIMI